MMPTVEQVLQRKTGSGMNDEWQVTVRLTNAGQRAGRDTAMLFASCKQPATGDPRLADVVWEQQHDGAAALQLPRQELRRWGRSPLLQPGESATLEFTLTDDDFALAVKAGASLAVSKRVVPGLWRLQAGSSTATSTATWRDMQLVL